MKKNKQTNEIITKNLASARRGKLEYQKLLKNFHEKKLSNIDNPTSVIFLFPSFDNEVNYYGLLYLEEFLFRTNKKEYAIITSNRIVYEVCQKIYSRNPDIYLLDDSDVNDIITYYTLYPFDSRLLIISLDAPVGRRATNLVGVKGLTKEMLVAIGIYLLIPFQPIRNNQTLRNLFDKEMMR